MDVTQFLAIFLSIFLAVFVMLAVVITVMLVRVTMQIRRVASSVEATVDELGEFATGALRTVSPIAFGRAMLSKLKKENRRSHNGKR